MYRNARGGREPLLPTAGSGVRSGNGGLYGARTADPSVSKSFIATVLWATVSVSLVIAGYLYCERKLETNTVKCDAGGCDIIQLWDGKTNARRLSRDRLVRAEIVRVKDGEMVNAAGMRRSAQKQLGYSYAVIYLEPDSEDDDDESYDSYEDDDDSYDSYDDDQDSSEEEEDDDDDVGPAARAPRAADKGDRGKTSPTTNNPDSGFSASEQKKAFYDKQSIIQKRDEQRRRRNEERAKRGLPPIREPDEQRRQGGRGQQEDDADRFPGDAGTMSEQGRRDRNRDEIRRMSDGMGGSSAKKWRRNDDYRARGKEAYDEVVRKDKERAKMEAMRQRIKDVKPDLSPDDPDNRPPRGRAGSNTPSGKEPKGKRRLEGDGGGVDDNANGSQGDERPGDGDGGPDEGAGAPEDGGVQGEEQRIRDPEQQPADLTKAGSGGGRTLSTLGEPVEMEEEEQEGWVGDESEASGARQRGGRRRLAAIKNRVPTRPQPRGARQRSRAEIERNARESREAHRRRHGHHQKRRRKAAHHESDEDGPAGARQTHHHRAFHHKKDVPMEDRHHVHHRYHHEPGQQKVAHGWRHQNRQSHIHEQLKLLGARYNLGRTKARARKEAIDKYVSRDGPSESHNSVSFSDSRRWRAGGLWMMIMGLISLIFCLMIGNFKPRPKVKKFS